MENVFFKPWVGAEYASGGIFGKRILVLGESHYTDGEPDPEKTTKVLNEYLSYDTSVPSYLQSFNKFERSLAGAAANGAVRRQIWNSVVFYNYLQTPMSGPRQAGQKSDYAASAAAFFEVLERYHPEYIIVWGYRLWDFLPANRWEWGESLTVNGKSYNVGAYLLSDGTRVKAISVKHPSAGYSWAEWHKVLCPFLQLENKHSDAAVSIEETVVETDPVTHDAPLKDAEHIEIANISDKILMPAVYSDLSEWGDMLRVSYASIDEAYSVNMNAEVLLPKIRKAIRKAYFGDDGYTRSLGILDKIAKNPQWEHGRILVSLYLNTYCLRGKEFKTQVLNEPAERPFTDAPENIDYPDNIEPSKKLLRDGIDGICVFAAENKERAKEPYFICPSCKGTGKKGCCPTCEGSGRVQYVDGYYASGEERIKSGICTACLGSGKTDCPECGGEGRIEIYAPDYALVKSVKETVSQVVGLSYASP